MYYYIDNIYVDNMYYCINNISYVYFLYNRMYYIIDIYMDIISITLLILY